VVHLMSRLIVACYGTCSVNPLMNQEIISKFYFSYVHSVFIIVQFSWVSHTIVIETLKCKRQYLHLLRIQ